jgi:DNA-directed RNA polymerase
MIVPPSDWVGPREGGYRWLQVDLMRTRGSNFQKEALHQGDLPLVFDGLNILGKTAWKINKEILEVSQLCWENNIAIGDIPSRTDHQLPPEPVRPERIAPEIYADTESTAAQAAIAANKTYRESTYKRHKMNQKNMVSCAGHTLVSLRSEI